MSFSDQTAKIGLTADFYRLVCNFFNNLVCNDFYRKRQKSIYVEITAQK